MDFKEQFMGNYQDRIGISGNGYYIPGNIVTTEQLARMSKLDEGFFQIQYGLKHKAVATCEETPSMMGIAAAEKAIDHAGINGEDLSLIIFCSAGFYDYSFWSPAAVVQNAVKAKNAFAFEIRNFCNVANVAIDYCVLKIRTDPEIEHALVVCSDKMSDMIDFTNETSKSIMFYADGAAAAVISRDSPRLKIKSFYSQTDAELSDHQQYIPVGGTVIPAYERAFKREECFIQVKNPVQLKKIFDEIYVPYYIRAIEEALKKDNKTKEDIDLLLTNQLRPKITSEILEELSLSEKQTFSTLSTVGHIGAADTLLCLAKCIEYNRIDSGDTVVLASSANGFSWGALVLEG